MSISRETESSTESFPNLTTKDLVDLGGWPTLREARRFCEQGRVVECEWVAPVIRGRIELAGTSFTPRLNLRSLTFAENQCNCDQGRRGYICAHSIALCVSRLEARAKAHRDAEREEKVREKERNRRESLEVGSLVISKEKGLPLTFEILLPPNLARVADRDAIMVKIEALTQEKRLPPEKLDRGRAYSVENGHYHLAALIESLCGGRLHGILQLTRRQLLEALELVKEGRNVFWANDRSNPIPWKEGRLESVHEFLEEGTPELEFSESSAGDTISSKELPSPSSAPHPESAPSRPSARRTFPSLKDLPSQEFRIPEHRGRSAAGKSDPGTARSDSGIPMQVDGSTQYLAIALPAREDPSYSDALHLVKSNGFQLDPRNRLWWLRDRHKTLGFLATHWKSLEEKYGANFSENFRQRTSNLRFADFQAEATEAEDKFSLTLSLRAGRASEEEIGRAIQLNTNYIDSSDGVFLLDPAQVSQLHELQRSLSGQVDRPLTPRFRRHLSTTELADAEVLIEEAAGPLETPNTWKARSAALRSIGSLQQAPVRQSFDDRMRGYQRIGTAWLWHLFRHRLGGILADEMGLGKTIQALALIDCVRDQKEVEGVCLVVCPAGLVENWRREAGEFVPWLRTAVHHRERRMKHADDFSQFDIIFTSYSTLTRDVDLFRGASLSLIIADEAQHIKNRRTQSARALRSLVVDNRFILTGTPIENSLDDLRSLFEFLMPGYLSRIPSECGREERAWFDVRHSQQAAPYILRRSKVLVAPELPEKIEQVIFCEMGHEQSALYRKVQETTLREISEMEIAGEGENKIRFAALTRLLRLRQICTDPRLVERKFGAQHSAKLSAFIEILDQAVDGDHRILLFSQFVSALKLLKTALDERGLPFAYLDGATRNRLSICDRFNADSSIPVFLISLKAGGTGLNLTGADTVVHFDPWWNPAVEAQATDRAHRIGQTRVVTSIKLITTDTVEEKVLELQKKKSDILHELLDESAAATAKVSLAEIKSLIS